MSAAPLPGPARPAGPAASPGPARLELVSAPTTRAARAPFVLLVLGLLAVGLLGLLMLNTVLAQNAFRLHDLQRRSLLLADRQQQLDTTLTGQRAPGLLAAKAKALGMVPGVARAFVRLADGRVVEVLSPAPRPVPTPAGTPSAKALPPKPAIPPAGAVPSPRATATPRPSPPATPTAGRR